MSTDWPLFFPPGKRVLALPSWQDSRLYLPAQRFTQRWEGSSFYPASRFRARLYRSLLRIRAATGLVAVRTVESGDWPLGNFVHDVLPQARAAAVLVGTPGPAQKITARLQDEKGRVVGYLKYAEKEAARSGLRREHHMLSTIPGELAPKVLKYGTLGNGKALLTTPVLGRQLPATLPPAKGVTDFLRSFPGSSPIPVGAHPWVRSAREWRTEGIELDTCFDALASRHWPIVAQHGDFAPWNLLRKPEGTVGAFDWEYGTLEGFPYLDLAHYALQVSSLINRWAPTKAVQCTVRYLIKESGSALSSTEARAMTCLAAYDAYQKFLEDGRVRDDRWQMWRRAVAWESRA